LHSAKGRKCLCNALTPNLMTNYIHRKNFLRENKPMLQSNN